MSELKGIHERLDRMDERLDRMEGRFDQVMRVVEQLVNMVAENNRAVADLRSEMTGMEERLSDRLANVEEQFRRDRALRDGESRHFAQSIGVLARCSHSQAAVISTAPPPWPAPPQ